MKSIIIIGYMGAGKTTVGKALAKELGVMFYDLVHSLPQAELASAA